jgi:putative redox protein
MYADKKDWPLENLEVKVSLVINAETKSVEFNREISLSGYINEEQKQRMLQIANVCPVHKILSSTLTINTQLK